MVDRIQTTIDKLFKPSNVTFFLLIFNILYFAYLLLIQNNDIKNLVKIHEEKINKIELQMDKKVDKETFQQLYLQGTETRLDIKDLRLMLMEHINK